MCLLLPDLGTGFYERPPFFFDIGPLLSGVKVGKGRFSSTSADLPEREACGAETLAQGCREGSRPDFLQADGGRGRFGRKARWGEEGLCRSFEGSGSGVRGGCHLDLRVLAECADVICSFPSAPTVLGNAEGHMKCNNDAGEGLAAFQRKAPGGLTPPAWVLLKLFSSSHQNQ